MSKPKAGNPRSERTDSLQIEHPKNRKGRSITHARPNQKAIREMQEYAEANCRDDMADYIAKGGTVKVYSHGTGKDDNQPNARFIGTSTDISLPGAA